MSTGYSLKQEVKEQLPWLFDEFGFRVVGDDFDPKTFGNSFVTIEAPGLRVRFVRDRGQVSAEVAAPADPGTWWNLEHVYEVIVGRTVDVGVELAAVAALLRDNFTRITNGLGTNFTQTKQELERRAEERKQALVKRLSR